MTVNDDNSINTNFILEQRFLPQLGLLRVKSHLERLLNEKYQQSLAPTLRALEELSRKTEMEIQQIKGQLSQNNLEVI